MDHDLLVIGGGINGVGVAADAAGRGLRVILCEMGDLANATSSASSKLIHGGIRYLETYEFKLVRESLRERRILRALAPHLIHIQPFVLPHCPGLRPYWLIRLGLFMYDHLAYDPGMPSSCALDANEVASLQLNPQFKRALQYYDCTEDDSRLVLHVALLAQQHGAKILTHTKLTSAQRTDSGWNVILQQNNADNSQQQIKLHVKAIVNAAGPWVEQVANQILHIETQHRVKLDKGSHIIVPKLFTHDEAFILQNSDGRVVFLIPYLREFTLIGTTDIPLKEIEFPTKISHDEIKYLCDTVNQFSARKITPHDVVHSYSGIRPLFDDHAKKVSKVTRDYVIDVDDTIATAPVFSIFGGKITTYRHLAEALCNSLKTYFPQCGDAWTEAAILPGGDFPDGDVDSFKLQLIAHYPYVDPKVLMHYVNNYGTRALQILESVNSTKDLGVHFGALLYQVEVDYLVKHEWARSSEDILWRRGKMGMWFDDEQTTKLETYLGK